MKYWNKVDKNQWLINVHFKKDGEGNIPDHLVELPDDHMAFQPRPEGKRFVFDADGVPTSYEDQYQPTFESEKAAKGRDLSIKYFEAMELILSPYPQAERDTFPEQAYEAIEYQKVVDAAGSPVEDDYPMLKGVAQQKGIALGTQQATVMGKRAAMNSYCGQVTGKRHALETQIEACTTQAELDAINIEEVLTFGQGLLA